MPGTHDLFAPRTREPAAIGRAEAQADWMGALLRAFGGSPAGWEWTGEILDLGAPTGRCACGHEGCRYLYPWQNKARPNEVVVTGSTCVENVEGIEPASLAAIHAQVESMRKAAADAARKAEQAAKDAEVRECFGRLRSEWQGRCAVVMEKRGWLDATDYARRRGCARDLSTIRHAGTLRSPAAQLRAVDELATRYGVPCGEKTKAKAAAKVATSEAGRAATWGDPEVRRCARIGQDLIERLCFGALDNDIWRACRRATAIDPKAVTGKRGVMGRLEGIANALGGTCEDEDAVRRR